MTLKRWLIAATAALTMAIASAAPQLTVTPNTPHPVAQNRLVAPRVTIVTPTNRAAIAAAQQPTVTLNWTLPTLRTDGSTITGALTINLYVGLSGNEVAAGSTTGTTTTLSGNWGGTTQCFKISASEAGGGTSALTNEVCATFPLASPNSPTGLTVTVVTA